MLDSSCINLSELPGGSFGDDVVERSAMGWPFADGSGWLILVSSLRSEIGGFERGKRVSADLELSPT
jgi:hypothetical protein